MEITIDTNEDGKVALRIPARLNGDMYERHIVQDTEEGYEARSQLIYVERGHIISGNAYTGVDCDGRLDWHGRAVASHIHVSRSGKLTVCRWKEIDQERRDSYAEMAGY